MNTHMVRVGRQEIWVAVKPGSKERPPLLLFNGIGANLELAEPFMRAMTNVEVVIFDIPGVGGSPLPALPYRASTIARWAAAIMKQLGYNKIDVAGAICRKLILAATSPGAIMVPGRISVLWKMAGPRRYIDKGYMRKIAADIYGGSFRDDPDLINAHAKNMKGASDLGYLYQLLALAGWTSLPWLHTLNQPTLILMGNDDPIVPLINGQILTRLIRGSRLQILQDGHLFFVTKPQETALMVEGFIADE
jgi:poly(3-hydroxyalkanoate) depolymerase